MSTETRSSLDKILKDVYLPAIIDEVATFDAVARIFESQDNDMVQWSGDGRRALTLHDLSWQEGTVAIAEGGNLPTAGIGTQDNGVLDMKFIYGSIEMTAQSMKLITSGKAAWAAGMKFVMDRLVKRMKKENSRMIWGTGQGRLALVNGAVAASTTINVDTPGGFAGAFGARFLRKGMIILITDNDVAITAVRTIASVSATGTSIVVDAAVTVADNALIYRCATTAETTFTSTSKNNEPMGISGIVSNATTVATFETLSRATYPQLSATVDPAVGAITLDRISRNFDIAAQRSDTVGIDCLACHHSVRRAILTQLAADRRFTNELLRRPDVGIDAVSKKPMDKEYVTFGGVPVIESTNAPYDTLYGLTKGGFSKYVKIEGEWADDDGAVLSRVPGKDSFNAFYRQWLNRTGDPKSNFVMTGITSSISYVQQY